MVKVFKSNNEMDEPKHVSWRKLEEQKSKKRVFNVFFGITLVIPACPMFAQVTRLITFVIADGAQGSSYERPCLDSPAITNNGCDS